MVRRQSGQARQESGAAALLLPNTKPTEYGLGKSGWVSASFPDGEIPVDLLKAWIDESYRAQAPKKFLKQLDGGVAAPVKPAPKKRRKR